MKVSPTIYSSCIPNLFVIPPTVVGHEFILGGLVIDVTFGLVLRGVGLGRAGVPVVIGFPLPVPPAWAIALPMQAQISNAVTNITPSFGFMDCFFVAQIMWHAVSRPFALPVGYRTLTSSRFADQPLND